MLVPRLEAFALGSHKNNSQGAQVVGIDPLLEDSLTGLANKLIKGQYLKANTPGILVAEGYARILELHVGDTLILLGQGYHGTTAVGQFEVTGIVRFGNPEINKSVTYLPLQQAQYVFGMPGRVTAMVMQFDNNYEFEKTVQTIRSQIDTGRYEVMNWREMNPSLVQAVQADT
jgi:ABC-type lipoprotein release transport system permease subunit